MGKEIRPKTAISHGKVSIPAIMIDEIDKSIGDLQRKIGIVGTGKMAATIGRYLYVDLWMQQGSIMRRHLI